MTDIRAVDVLDVLVDHGVTHLVGLPDNGSAALFEVASDDPRLDLLTVTREGEAFAVASGLWMGGRQPAVVCQNTGLLESGDSLRGTAIRMGVPLLLLVTYRGYASLRIERESGAGAPGAGLRRPDVDSVAVLTEPTLDAWCVPWELLGRASDLAAAITQARDESRPVARLITAGLT